PRTGNLETGLEVQQELLPRVSMTASWYRGNFHNLLQNDNQLVSLTDWTPVSVFNPIDGTPMTIYNLNASKRGQVSVLDTVGQSRQTYNSHRVQISAPLPRRASLLGGFPFDPHLRKTCGEPDEPNQLRLRHDPNPH